MTQLHAKVPDAKIEARKRVPLAGETDFRRGFSTVPDGYIVGDLHVIVDVPKLVAAIGARALRSKSKVTKLQAGAVIVKALNVRHERPS